MAKKSLPLKGGQSCPRGLHEPCTVHSGSLTSTSGASAIRPMTGFQLPQHGLGRGGRGGMQFWADRITREQHICRHTEGEETQPVLLQDVKPGGNPSSPSSPPPPTASIPSKDRTWQKKKIRKNILYIIVIATNISVTRFARMIHTRGY